MRKNPIKATGISWRSGGELAGQCFAEVESYGDKGESNWMNCKFTSKLMKTIHPIYLTKVA